MKKNSEITVLITGAGAPGIAGTIYCLRENEDNTQFKILSTDIDEDVVGRYLSDLFYKVPPPESSDYLDTLSEIVVKNRVNIILPQTTREIEVLSKQKDHFSNLNCKILVSDYDSIRKANDKYNILLSTQAVGAPVPDHLLVSNKNDFFKAVMELGFPKKRVVVKPRFSNGMRGVRIITNEKPNIDTYMNEKPFMLETQISYFQSIFENVDEIPELLVTEYLPGQEYTVDVLNINDQFVVVPRVRNVIRSGISFDITVDLTQSEIIKHSKLISKEVNLKHCFGFQFKLSKDGVPKILESNPRIQGTMVASKFAGCNMIYLAVKNLLGDRLDIDSIKLKNDVNFKRFWGGVGSENKKYLGSF